MEPAVEYQDLHYFPKGCCDSRAICAVYLLNAYTHSVSFSLLENAPPSARRRENFAHFLHLDQHEL